MKKFVYTPYKRVEFKNPLAIEFLGYDKSIGQYPFKIIGSDGQDTGYIGVFGPGSIAHTHFFEVKREAYVKAAQAGNTPSFVPIGICLNTRILAALMRLSYPTGALPADFKAIEEAVVSKKRIELPELTEAQQLVLKHQGIEFDNYNAANVYFSVQSREIEVADDTPDIPADMIP